MLYLKKYWPWAVFFHFQLFLTTKCFSIYKCWYINYNILWITWYCIWYWWWSWWLLSPLGTPSSTGNPSESLVNTPPPNSPANLLPDWFLLSKKVVGDWSPCTSNSNGEVSAPLGLVTILPALLDTVSAGLNLVGTLVTLVNPLSLVFLFTRVALLTTLLLTVALVLAFLCLVLVVVLISSSSAFFFVKLVQLILLTVLLLVFH